jgi:hypothetical protein
MPTCPLFIIPGYVSLNSVFGSMVQVADVLSMEGSPMDEK